MEQLIDFYEPFFPDRAAAATFVGPLEDLEREAPRHRAKIMMHQVQRLVSLADDIDQIRPNREALRLFFLIVCAENIAKLHANFGREGKSYFYVQNFFEKFVSSADRKVLESSIVDSQFHMLNLEQVARLLYDVRCDVVHEGNYWSFQFAFPDIPAITGEPPITVRIRYCQLRDIVVRAGVCAVETYAGD